MSGRPPPPSRRSTIDDEPLWMPGGFQFGAPSREPQEQPPTPPPPAEPVDEPAPSTTAEFDTQVLAGQQNVAFPTRASTPDSMIHHVPSDGTNPTPNVAAEAGVPERHIEPEDPTIQQVLVGEPDGTPNPQEALDVITTSSRPTSMVSLPSTDATVPEQQNVPLPCPDISSVDDQPSGPQGEGALFNTTGADIQPAEASGIAFPAISSPDSESPPIVGELHNPNLDPIEEEPTSMPSTPPEPSTAPTPDPQAVPLEAEPATRSTTPIHIAAPRPSTPVQRQRTPAIRPATPGSRPRTPAIRPATPVILLPPEPSSEDTRPTLNGTPVPSRPVTPMPVPPQTFTPQPNPNPEPEVIADVAADAFFESGSIEAANEAIETYKRILEAAKNDPRQEIPIEKQAEVVNKLSKVLIDRFDHFGDVDNIEEAVDSQVKIAEIAARTTDPVLKAELQAESFKGLGKTMTLQFEHTGDPEDARAAVDNLQQALNTIPQDSPARPAILGDMAKAKLARYMHMESDADLDQALDSCQQAIQVLPADSPARAPLAGTYGKALLAKFERSQNPAHINEAVQHLESAIALTPAASPERPKRLRTYGDALIARFKDQKNPEDVQTAIETQEQALTLLQPESTAIPEVQSSLAVAYHVKYKDLGRNVEDLDRAIDFFKRSVEETPFSSPEHARVTGQLGKAFMSKYRVVEEFELINYAVMLHQQALAQTPPGSRRRLDCLDNLAYAYSKRYRSSHRHGVQQVQRDKDNAIRLFKEALQEIGNNQNHPKYTFFRSEIGRLERH